MAGNSSSDVPGGAPTDVIRAIVARVAESHGLELFDLQLRREAQGWVLRVYLDRPETEAPSSVDGAQERGEGEVEADDGVTLGDCEHVSRDLSAVLDVEDVLDHAYTLEVSSPGLDRPLRGASDYRRFVGRAARIVVAEPVDNQTFLEGRLRGLDGETVLLEGGKQLYRIPFASIKRARLVVEL